MSTVRGAFVTDINSACGIFLWVRLIYRLWKPEEAGLSDSKPSRGPPSSHVNVAFTSGFKEGSAALLRAVDTDDSVFLFFPRIKVHSAKDYSSFESVRALGIVIWRDMSKKASLCLFSPPRK